MEECVEALETAANRHEIRSRVVKTLKEKGFQENQIRKDEPFVLETKEGTIRIPIEVLVCQEERPAILIKCINGNLATRERASVAMARLFPTEPVPFAIVASETDAVVMDTRTGKSVGFGYTAFPNPAAVAEKQKTASVFSLSLAQAEREKRILNTYYHLRCPAPGDPY